LLFDIHIASLKINELQPNLVWKLKGKMPSNNHFPLLILVSAPSGAGKTTICKRLLEQNPETITRAVSCTTRTPRPKEVNGIDYYFLSQYIFDKDVENGLFLEHAIVYGNSYGVTGREINRNLMLWKNVLLNIDVQGARTIRNRPPSELILHGSLVTIFIIPPSPSELENRLRKRSEDSEEAIRTRLEVAKHEVNGRNDFMYTVVNDELDKAVSQIESIITAEQLLSQRQNLPQWK